MEERTTNKCPHSNLSIEEAEEKKSKYMWLLTDPDEFPKFEPCVCTADCKEKIVKKNRFKERTELLTNLQYIDGKVVRLCAKRK
ncbi:hypothetical protein DDB_G0294240 [Dictyostelium discoideum AX4]|uniref:Uncharacterized protein n=1 Tax=Dictyostelium discoideum TaxID=44689 RepID=Q54AS6_DICDI|nr:hypothetical protein DDB_G0294240 [Dictyostelium discoideum AX4]EAL60364.1 hypothetical protein DDB_G0294240 [Dictyostelium discoideum AX4]|eukprot:XP_628777.1 hypothetical protein DDB_G0294240 [Dictyostelium discoideum AX4]